MRTRVVLGIATATTAAAVIALAWLHHDAEPGLPPSPQPLGSDPNAPTTTATGQAPKEACRDEPAALAPATVVGRETPQRYDPWPPAAAAFLAAARGDRAFTVVTAEVVIVGTIQRGLVGEGDLEHQDVRLRVLVPPADGSLRRYLLVDAPLCPATSQQLHGVSTPFGALAPGQVRTFVLGRGRPDFGALAKLLGHRARWLVLAGPEVERPVDPVLAAVPPELHGWLGRSEANVFRARVVMAKAGEGGAGGVRSLARQFDQLTVEVLQTALPGSRLKIASRVRLVQEPFLANPAVANLAPGSECWFVSEDAGLLQILRAFAPAR